MDHTMTEFDLGRTVKPASSDWPSTVRPPIVPAFALYTLLAAAVAVELQLKLIKES